MVSALLIIVMSQAAYLPLGAEIGFPCSFSTQFVAHSPIGTKQVCHVKFDITGRWTMSVVKNGHLDRTSDIFVGEYIERRKVPFTPRSGFGMGAKSSFIFGKYWAEMYSRPITR